MKKNFAKYSNAGVKNAASPPRSNPREGKLYQRMNKAGENETNALDWIRGWKQYKMGSYPPELSISLKDFVRVKYITDEKVKDLKYEAELPTSKDCWTPSVSEQLELSNLSDDPKIWRERAMYTAWFTAQAEKNAEIRHRNDLRKAQKDDIVKKGELRGQVIGDLMGAILGDMSPESRKEIEQWTRDPDEEINLVGGEQRGWIADNIDEAHEIGDWLFIFEAVSKTHLMKPLPKEDTAIQQRRDTYIDNLKKIKHETGTTTESSATLLDVRSTTYDYATISWMELTRRYSRTYWLSGRRR